MKRLPIGIQTVSRRNTPARTDAGAAPAPPAGWREFGIRTGTLFLRPERPDWIVLSRQAADLLKNDPGPAGERLRLLMQSDPPPPYRGRGRELALDGLRECWFHLTNRCNLACGHCLFAASPARRETIGRDLLLRLIDEAAGLGCRVFYFTGGEPLVYEDFAGVAARILRRPDTHVVVLSNGVLAEEFIGRARAAGCDPGRIHFQVSVDGMEAAHDRIRGRGNFKRAVAGIRALAGAGIAATMSVAVNRENLRDLAGLADLAARLGCRNIHLLWHFVRGKGSDAQFVPPEEIIPELERARQRARAAGVGIDNVEGLRTQVFSPAGTRYDLANSGWESLAVGPDGTVFPSPALVGETELACGDAAAGLEKVWRTSPVLERVRNASLADDPATADDPWRFLVGGGDIDHSFIASGRLVGGDPYLPLYREIARRLIEEAAEAAAARAPEDAAVLLRMGELRANCPDGGRSVSLTHCNCVLSLASDQGRAEVREFYGRAALATNEDIVNPFAPAADDLVPEAARKRSYGCGSPVEAAAPGPGETVVDLGSGSGVECFMAARAVGPEGRVVGVDMTDDMLALARETKKEVTARLGYDNVEFVKGFLEDIPLPDGFADVVISNCVINLSPDKRTTFHEIRRILKPGGRLVVSDVVSDGEVAVAVKNDERFRGECLGGALDQFQLVAMLGDAGFVSVRLLKRFPYREEAGTEFFSLTYEAIKPGEKKEMTGIYRGPYAAVLLDDGTMMYKGRATTFSARSGVDDSIFVLGDGGRVANVDMGAGCCGVVRDTGGLPQEDAGCGCGQGEAPPLQPMAGIAPLAPPAAMPRKKGCMVCGAGLRYTARAGTAVCSFCGQEEKSNAACEHGHFVCDACHRRDAVAAIRVFCENTQETDMIAMLKALRRHPAVPMHGPEHHAMVPGIIVAAARNAGFPVPEEAVACAVERGGEVPGGACGFRGICGAATGAGIAFAVLLEATPVAAAARRKAQAATARILARIAETEAGRCCQRESWTALRETADMSEEILGVRLAAAEPLACGQFRDNRECIGKRCPLFPGRP